MLVLLLLLSLVLSHAQIATAGDPAVNCGCETQSQNVLAVVNGIKITKTDLSIDTRTQISVLQDSVVDARRRAVQRRINQMLLEAEARRRGLSVDGLIQGEIKDKIDQPTEKEARALYGNKAGNADNFKQLKPQLLAQIRSEREVARAELFTEALRAGAKITISEERVTAPIDESELDRVFATVNGKPITSRDIENDLRPLVTQVQQQVYAYRKQDLDTKINDLLLDQEAKRLNTTPQALINQNVKAKMPLVTDEQAEAFYKANKARLPGSFSELKIQIMQLLMKAEERKLVLAYADQLRANAAVQTYLIAPLPTAPIPKPSTP
jgi:hypothetical protein